MNGRTAPASGFPGGRQARPERRLDPQRSPVPRVRSCSSSANGSGCGSLRKRASRLAPPVVQGIAQLLVEARHCCPAWRWRRRLPCGCRTIRAASPGWRRSPAGRLDVERCRGSGLALAPRPHHRRVRAARACRSRLVVRTPAPAELGALGLEAARPATDVPFRSTPLGIRGPSAQRRTAWCRPSRAGSAARANRARPPRGRRSCGRASGRSTLKLDPAGMRPTAAARSCRAARGAAEQQGRRRRAQLGFGRRLP